MGVSLPAIKHITIFNLHSFDPQMSLIFSRYLELVHPIWHKTHFNIRWIYISFAVNWIFGIIRNAYLLVTSKVKMFGFFCRAVALLFNWKYFWGLNLLRMMCGQCADDMRVIFQVRFHWQMTYVVWMLSAHHPDVICTSRNVHVICMGQQLCIKPTGFLVYPVMQICRDGINVFVLSVYEMLSCSLCKSQSEEILCLIRVFHKLYKNAKVGVFVFTA